MRFKSTRIVLAFIVILGSGLYLYGIHPTDSGHDFSCLDNKASLKAKIFAFERRFDLAVHYRVDENFLPAVWQISPVNGSAESLDEKELLRVLDITCGEMLRYPLKVIKRDLDALYLSKKLSLFGVDYGATILSQSVYLTSEGKEAGFSDDYLRRAFHHEFSSILIHLHPFSEKEWRAVNPPGFKYLNELEGEGEVLEVVARGEIRKEPAPELLKQGFLAEYGKTSLENDVNTYVENYFLNNGEVSPMLSRRINEKLKIIKNFYKSIE